MRKSHFMAIIFLMAMTAAVYIFYQDIKVMKQSELKVLAQPTTLPRFIGAIYGEGENYLREPMALAVDGGGNIYVADTGNSRIVVFDKQGKLKFSFGERGHGKLFYPVDLSLSRQEIKVVDLQLRKIYRYSLQGKFLGEFVPQSTYEINPTAIVEDTRGNVYITETNRQRILVFDPNGRQIKAYGREPLPAGFRDFPLQEGRFNYPNGISLDQKGRIWVADSNNGRIQIINPDGDIKIFSGYFAREKMAVPRAIRIDSEGNVFIADTLGQKVFAFNNQGRALFTLSSNHESAPRVELVLPAGIAVHEDKLYIAEKGAHRISIFQLTTRGSWVKLGNNLRPFWPLLIIMVILLYTTANFFRKRVVKK